MKKVLVVCGPTATGKTELALALADKFSGELISSDSRQIYIGMDIVTGKDIPPNYKKVASNIVWHDRPLTYYTDGQIRIWLTDVIYPNESFNVSFFNECANLILADIHSRSKLPIVVGATGLYIKSLTHDLSDIHKPFDLSLREALADKPADYLYSHLSELNPLKSAQLNYSDRKNPRRLIRAIEVSLNTTPSTPFPLYNYFQLGLQGDRQKAYERINDRVLKRIASGAEQEVKQLIDHGFGWQVSSMRTSGNFVWKDYFTGEIPIEKVTELWQIAEHSDYRNQERWFKKQSLITWFNIDLTDWRRNAFSLVDTWYNKSDA